jgi:hypothetical protein
LIGSGLLGTADKEEFKSQMAQKRPEEVLRAASDDVIDDVLTHLGLGGDKVQAVVGLIFNAVRCARGTVL